MAEGHSQAIFAPPRSTSAAQPMIAVASLLAQSLERPVRKSDVPAWPPARHPVAAGHDILVEGDRVDHAWLLLEGWACRFATLPDGRRQIIGFVLPGELCAAWPPASERARYAVRTLTAARLASIPFDRMPALLAEHPGLGEQVRAAAAIEQSVLAAWLANLGLRKAPERIAHLFCELAHRIGSASPRGRAESVRLPLTQQELAEALGLTNVHVNRVLQRLKRLGLIEFRRGVLLLRDIDKLRELAGFDEGYLAP